MKRIIALMVLVVIVSMCNIAISIADAVPDEYLYPQVEIDGNDLVVYALPAKPKILETYKDIFDASVDVEKIKASHYEMELSRLVKGEISEFLPTHGYYGWTDENVKKVYFWHHPLKVETSFEKWKFVLNEEKKISVTKESSPAMIGDAILSEVIFRDVVVILLFIMVFTRHTKRLLIFYVGMPLVVLGGAYLGVHYATNGCLLAMIVSLLFGIVVGASVLGWIGAVIGAYCGLIMSGYSSVFAARIGWENAAINNYVIFIIMISTCCFLIGLGIEAIGRKILQRK
ncbi:MAG: hypothetical protein WC819_02155 [Parcubacteria group bacterium]